EGIPVFWANDVRLLLLTGANLWALWLATSICQRYASSLARCSFAIAAFCLALLMIDYAWALMFWIW
ncbi:MAG TPA: 4Fe-4S binding protein, partial [Polaromonas sp.]